jgi:hypothetical protein
MIYFRSFQITIWLIKDIISLTLYVLEVWQYMSKIVLNSSEKNVFWSASVYLGKTAFLFTTQNNKQWKAVIGCILVASKILRPFSFKSIFSLLN